MRRITCRPCLIFDALGAFIFKDYCRTDLPETAGWVKKTFGGVKIDPGNAFYDVLMAHHSLSELEGFTLDRLLHTYPDYIDENGYVRRFAPEILKALDILRRSGFARVWAGDILPVLNRQCTDFLSACDDGVISGILRDIGRLKKTDAIDKIHVSMTYFTWPVSFHLSADSYLTNLPLDGGIDAGGIMRLFAHELAHRFSNEASRSAYRAACENDPYLKKTNRFLSIDLGSPGDEEEFVTAIEHAVAVRNGLETYGQALEDLFHRYKSCMPVAVLLFTELYKLKDLPGDMNDWICSRFADGAVPVGRVADKLDALLPGYVERFDSLSAAGS